MLILSSAIHVSLYQYTVASQHLETSPRVKPFRPKTSCKARDWILEQIALGDVDI